LESQIISKSLCARNQECSQQDNSLVEKSAIRHKHLPRKEFPNGLIYFDRKMRSNVVVVHNNYIIGHENEEQRFKNVGLWWNNECP
jgi:hypothetical protein